MPTMDDGFGDFEDTKQEDAGWAAFDDPQSRQKKIEDAFAEVLDYPEKGQKSLQNAINNEIKIDIGLAFKKASPAKTIPQQTF